MKAIVILDEMPTDCKECPCIDNEEGYCKVDKYLRQCVWTKNEKSDWCPLRPMPLKGTMENVVECEYNRGFVDGRNHFIELITGETE